MDLGCKLIVGRELQEEPPSLPRFPTGESVQRIFLRFYFCLRGMGRGGGRAAKGGGVVCPPCTTNAVSVFSLSLSSSYSGTNWAPWPVSRQGPAEDDRPPRPCPRRGHRPPPAAISYLARDSFASPPGPPCSGRGSRRDCVMPSLPPQKRRRRTRPPADPRCPRTEDSGGHRAPAGRLVCSCIELSRVPSSRPPSVSSSPLPPSPSCPLLPRFSTGKRFPSPPSWITSSRHISFSFLFVCLFKLFPLLPPFSFPLPPSSAM